MQTSAFTPVTSKPRYRCTVCLKPSAKDGLLTIYFYSRLNEWLNKLTFSSSVVICDSEENGNDPVIFATEVPTIIPLKKKRLGGEKSSVATRILLPQVNIANLWANSWHFVHIQQLRAEQYLMKVVWWKMNVCPLFCLWALSGSSQTPEKSKWIHHFLHQHVANVVCLQAGRLFPSEQPLKLKQ